MYGYISIYFTPTEEERKSYLYYYCGLCHSLKENLGEFYRLTTVKEVVFFSMLNNPLENINEFRCPYVGLKKRFKPENNSFMTPYAYLNLLIIYGKLLDYNLEGKLVPKKILKKLEAKLFEYFDSKTINEYKHLLKMQQKVEEQNLDLDDYAKPSQEIMEMLFEKFFPQRYPATMPIVTAYLLYLVDSVYDFNKDIKKRNFNSIASSFGVKKLDELTQDQKERILFTYDLCSKEFLENVEEVANFNKHLVKKLATFSLIYHRNSVTKILDGGEIDERATNHSRANKKGRVQKPIFKI